MIVKGRGQGVRRNYLLHAGVGLDRSCSCHNVKWRYHSLRTYHRITALGHEGVYTYISRFNDRLRADCAIAINPKGVAKPIGVITSPRRSWPRELGDPITSRLCDRDTVESEPSQSTVTP